MMGRGGREESREGRLKDHKREVMVVGVAAR